MDINDDERTPRMIGSYLGFQSSAAGVAKRLLEVEDEIRLTITEQPFRVRLKLERKLDRAALLAKELEGLAARFSRWPEVSVTAPEQMAQERAPLYGWLTSALREAEELIFQLTHEPRDPRAEDD